MYSEKEGKLTYLNDPKSHPLGYMLEKEDILFLGSGIEDELLLKVVKGDYDLSLNKDIDYHNLAQYKEENEIVDF